MALLPGFSFAPHPPPGSRCDRASSAGRVLGGAEGKCGEGRYTRKAGCGWCAERWRDGAEV